jgi:cardiolipin synthase
VGSTFEELAERCPRQPARRGDQCLNLRNALRHLTHRAQPTISSLVRGDSTLAFAIRAARRLGVSRLARQLPEHELDAYAFSLSYMLRARTWLLLKRAPGWPAIERAWCDSLAGGAHHTLSAVLDTSDAPRLLVDSGEAFAVRERLLDRARTSVDLSTYYFQADATGWSAARALVMCAQRGVRVRLLIDRYMLERKRRETPELATLVAYLRRGGVEVRLWHDALRPFDSNHRKILVVDNQAALVGGRNFADHYRLGAWRDVDLVVSGPSVRSLSALFDTVWSALPPAGFAPWFDHRPYSLLADPTARFALACIQGARRSIVLELAYLVGPNLLTRSLVHAARRDVHVRVLTNSAESTDLPYVGYAAYSALRELLAGGVEVRVRRGAGRTLHSKYLVVDDEWVLFGSHNLDYYSSRFCCETTLQVHGGALASQLTECFVDGVRDSDPPDLHAEVLPFLRRARGLEFFNWAFRDFQ